MFAGSNKSTAGFFIVNFFQKIDFSINATKLPNITHISHDLSIIFKKGVMVKIFSLLLSVLIFTIPMLAMEKLQSTFNQFCFNINKRITNIAQKTCYKKRGITTQKLLTTRSILKSEMSVHPLHMFTMLNELETFCNLLIKTDILKTRMRDLQYTIYIQQATIHGLQAVARNPYVLDHQIKYMVPLIQGNSKMYSAIQEAAQYSLDKCYDLAQIRVAPSKTWFAAVKEIESEVTQTLQDNQHYYAALNTLFNHAVKQLAKYESIPKKIQAA